MGCPRCGAEVDASDAFCRACGQELVPGLSSSSAGISHHVRVTTHTVTRLICTGCGKQVTLGEPVCPSCGHAMPSKEEIEARLRQARAPGASAQEPASASETMKCPHCGSALNLMDGRCTTCGQHVELPAVVREALEEAVAGSTPGGVTLKPFRVRTRLKISLVTAGILVGFLGLLAFVAARQPFTLRGPLSPLHVAAFLLWSVAVVLVLVGKTRPE
jgi:predicted amidophosphoribosyltransferase